MRLYLLSAIALLALCLALASHGQSTAPVYVDNERPAVNPPGACTGKCLVLQNPLAPGTEHVYRNGIRLTLHLDYKLLGGSTIQIFGPNDPQPGDVWLVDYRTQ